MLAREQPTAAALAAENEMDPAAMGLQHAPTLASGAAGAVRAIEKAGTLQGAPPLSHELKSANCALALQLAPALAMVRTPRWRVQRS